MSDQTRKKDIDALVMQIQSQYKKIESFYKNSLRDKKIKSTLKIRVKNYLENARSVLDYCAHDIADATGITARKIYFPIVGKDKAKINFEGNIGSNLPGLELKNKKIFDYLESIQPYHNNYSWLADLATVTIDNKHSRLTPQIRVETPSLSIKHGGAGIKLSGRASISIGQGASISLGGATIAGGQSISPESQKIYGDPRLQVRKEIWVDFLFDNKVSVINLLEKIRDGLPIIINEIYKLL